jgi:hypothetical protein
MPLACADSPPEALDAFVDEYRARCLWFLRDDFYPRTEAEWLSVLGHVERHGDVTAYRRSSAIRRWLSHNSNATSAG